MKNLDFAEKHGITYSVHTFKIEQLTLHPYQKTILTDLENNRFIAIQHSRQMGLTTMLVFHIANFLLHNTNNKNLICLKTPNNASSRHTINHVRTLLSYYNETNKIKYIKNNQTSLKLENGNEVRLITDINSLNLPTTTEIDTYHEKNKDYPYALILDNAAWVKDADVLVNQFIKIGCNQIIVVSGKRIEPNAFYDKIYTNQNNVFIKKQINWKMNPRRDDLWYEEMKKNFGGNLNAFHTEVDLIDVPNETTKIKDRVINVRLDDDTMNKLSLKLLEKDLSLSEYIRTLINKDI